MSNDDSAEGDDAASLADFGGRLDDAREALDDAETEADLDDVEATLDEVADDISDMSFAEDDDEDPAADLENRIDELREELDDQRGPYVEEVTDELDSATTTLSSSELTEEGFEEAITAVELFFSAAADVLDDSFETDTSDVDALVGSIEDVSAAVADSGLHPDDSSEEIATLLEGAETLAADVDDVQVFGDLEVREQLRRQGFYDVLDPETRKDFPPEWGAIKLYEANGEVEPILSAMEKLDSDYMEENILDALEHIAPVEAFDAVHQLAQRRNVQPVRILGRIGDERACDTLEDFLGGGDVKLETTALRALGAIGSEDSTQPVAQRLVADNAEVRSAAARALGCLGDTRAIEPLGDVLADDDADEVRASAAWALNQIGTERALAVASEYADDRSYIVQVEAEKATGV